MFQSRYPRFRISPVIRVVRTLEIKALFSSRRIYRHEDYLTPSYGRMEQAAHHIIPEGLKSPKEGGLQTARLTSVAHVNPDVNEPVFAIDPALRQSAFRLTPTLFPPDRIRAIDRCRVLDLFDFSDFWSNGHPEIVLQGTRFNPRLTLRPRIISPTNLPKKSPPRSFRRSNLMILFFFLETNLESFFPSFIERSLFYYLFRSLF